MLSLGSTKVLTNARTVQTVNVKYNPFILCPSDFSDAALHSKRKGNARISEPCGSRRSWFFSLMLLYIFHRLNKHITDEM